MNDLRTEGWLNSVQDQATSRAAALLWVEIPSDAVTIAGTAAFDVV